MTDQELVDLLQQTAPEDLTAEQVELLRGRLAASPELRSVLSERLQMEQYLADALGRGNVSVDQILALSGSVDDPRSGTSMPPWGWVLCLLIGVLLATGLVMIVTLPDQQTQARPVVAAGEKSAEPDVAITESPAEPPANPQVENPSDGDTPASEPEEGTGPKPMPTTADPNPAVAAQVPPAGPWEETLALGPFPADEVWLRNGVDGRDGSSDEEFQAWFDLKRGRLHKRGIHLHRLGRGVEMGSLSDDAIARLKSPWAEDHVLRFSIHDPQKFRIHFWSGERGVTLIRTNENARPSWAAYATTRKNGKEPRPDSFTLASSDEDRAYRLNRHGAPLELRCRAGAISLSCGGIPLVTAPFGGLPEEVYFEGRAALGGIELVRSPGPHPSLPKQNLKTIANWPAAEAPWIGETREKTRREKRPDGSLVLSAEKGGNQATIAVAIPQGGFREVLFEIEAPQLFTGLFFGNAKGEPQRRVSVQREKSRDRLVLGFTNDGYWPETQMDLNHHVVPYLPERFWVRMLLGAGQMRVGLSGDGKYWSRAVVAGIGDYRDGAATAGVYCTGRDEAASITIRRVIVRDLAALSALAPDGVLERANSLPNVGDMKSWLAEVDKSRPGNVSRDVWRCGCALATLQHNPPKHVGYAIVNALVRDVLDEDDLKVESKLDALDQLARVIDVWDSGDRGQANRFRDYYFELAERAAAQGEDRAYTKIAERWLTTPLWTYNPLDDPPSRAIRGELLSLAYHDRWAQAYTMCQRLQARDQRHLVDIVPWIEAWAARQVPNLVDSDATLLAADWRHPLVAEVGKEAFNVIAEFEAALAGKSYKSACRIISSGQSFAALGLLPSSRDPQLLVSLGGAVAIAMREHPELRQAMSDEYGPLGGLRVRKAIDEGDVETLRAATIQFFGTEAAGIARSWLGDRSLARGDFVEALEQYRLALETAPLAQHVQIAARQRLAGAMLGRDLGKKVETTVQFNDVKLSPGDFERLVDEMRRTHQGVGNVGRAGNVVSASAHQAPPPTGIEVKGHGRLDGQMGNSPNESPDGISELLFDWRARQLGLAVADDTLYVSNKFQVSAYDLGSGNRRWQQELSSDRGKLRDWSIAPMRPLVTKDRIYVRSLGQRGPELVALQRDSGQRLWKSSVQDDRRRGSQGFVASDPLLAQDQLLAVVVYRNDRLTELSLAVFDPDTGNVVSQQTLVTLHNTWWDRRVCEAIATGDAVVVNFGGGTVCSDLTGRVRWVRREQWLPVSEDRTSAYQSHDSPLVIDRRVILAQPGVRSVQCVDLDTGRAQWRQPLPDVRRLVGQVDGTLIVETDDGLLALSVEDGKRLWHHPAERLMDGRLWGGPGGLLYAARELVSDANGPYRARLVWVDLKTGQAKASTTLGGWEDRDLKLGPMIRHKERTWAFLGRGHRDPNRDFVELAPQGAAAAGLDNDAWASAAN